MIAPEVDHSEHFGPARHQGMRLTCLAFAVSDLNRRVATAPDLLSPEFLYQTAGSLIPSWSPGDGLYLTHALQAAAQPGQPLEALFPYQPHAHATPAAPSAPPGATLYASQFKPIAASAAEVAKQVRLGNPVGVIVACTQTLYQPVDGLVQFSPYIIPDCAHAVLVVGIGQNGKGEEHFLIRNSWGPNWGLRGHAWLSKRYVDLHALEAFGR